MAVAPVEKEHVRCQSALSGNLLEIEVQPTATLDELKRRLYCSLHAEDEQVEDVALFTDDGQPVADNQPVNMNETYRFVVISANQDTKQVLESIKERMSLSATG